MCGGVSLHRKAFRTLGEVSCTVLSPRVRQSSSFLFVSLQKLLARMEEGDGKNRDPRAGSVIRATTLHTCTSECPA